MRRVRIQNAQKKISPLLGRRSGHGALECADWVAAIFWISDGINVMPRFADVTTFLER